MSEKRWYKIQIKMDEYEERFTQAVLLIKSPVINQRWTERETIESVEEVEVRPLHEEPCPWEKKSDWKVMEYIGDKEGIEPDEYLSGRGCFGYCPKCGRRLKEER
jgi:hypothetical protein